MRPAPPWFHDPTDDQRYAVAENGKCPADGHPLATDAGDSVMLSHCTWCRRCFYAEDGKRVGRTWWTSGEPDPSKDELHRLLVTMLRSARPHPVEHPSMWRAWGLSCRKLGLNPDDYRIPTSDKDLERRLDGTG